MRFAIYVEGGGDTAQQKAELRQGMDELLKAAKNAVRKQGLGWKLVCAGGRQSAFEAFVHAIRIDPDAVNVLLVDAETSLDSESGDAEKDAAVRVRHLAARDRWDLSGALHERVHLMVQCMETWIVADREALAGFYGKGFRVSALPARKDLEEEAKLDVLSKLSTATRDTQKGEYAKIRHASKLLARIDPDKVPPRCPRFATFTGWLQAIIEEA